MTVLGNTIAPPETACLMADLSIHIAEGSPRVMYVRGELDACTAGPFGAALSDALSADPTLVVDMAEVTFIDVAGLRAILQAAESRNGSGPLTLLNAARLAWLLKLAGLTDTPSLALRDSLPRTRSTWREVLGTQRSARRRMGDHSLRRDVAPVAFPDGETLRKSVHKRHRRSTMVHLVEGRYKCDWCDADLDLVFADHESFTITTEHDGVETRTIVVGGLEHHRCQQAPKET